MAVWSEGSLAAKTDGDRFFVTKSGERLDRLTPASFVELPIPEVAAASANESAAGGDAAEILRGASPDAFLYAYLLGFEGVAFAARTQPIEVNQVICSPRARQFSDRRLSPGEIASCGQASLLIPYVDPGLARARELRKKMLLWKDRHKVLPKIVLFQNDGMLNLGATPDEILQTAEMAIKSAQIFVGAAMMGGPTFLSPSNVSQIEAPPGA
jgi:ribulose-5-phosphate 4-epimerase/fuculose-1-phosphate aldolase